MKKQPFFPILFLLCLVLGNGVSAQVNSYRVQVSAFDRKVPVSYFEGITGVTERIAYGGIYRYYVEGFATREDAEKLRQEAIKKGYKNARIVEPRDPNEQAKDCCVMYESGEPLKVEQTNFTAREMAPRDMAPREVTEAVRNIFFDFDKADLRQDAIAELDKLAQVLRKNETYSVTIYAHTDARGTDDYNVALSLRRRNAAMNYLLGKGITANRLNSVFYGETRPIAKNEFADGTDNPIGRQFNRRVEFSIMENGKLIEIVEAIPVPANMTEK